MRRAFSRRILDRCSFSVLQRRHLADRGYLRKDFSDRNYQKKGYVDPGNFSYTVKQDSRRSWKAPQYAGERFEDLRKNRDRERWKEEEEISSYPFTGSKLDRYSSGDERRIALSPPRKKDEEDEEEEEDSELVVRDRQAIQKTLSHDTNEKASSLQTFYRPDCRLLDICGSMEEDWQPGASDECLVFEMRGLFKQENVATWEAEDVVRSFGGHLRPYHVFEVLKSCTAAEAGVALAFFRWAGLQQSFQHVTATYNMMLKLLQEAAKYVEISELAREMVATEVPRTAETFKILLVSFLKGGFIEEALEVFSEMEGSSSSPPGFNEYKFVIDRMLRAECYSVVPSLLQSLTAAGHAPDGYVYNAVISSLCNVAKMDEAMKVFAKMKSKTGADLVTYTILIDGFVKCHNATGATTLFVEMLSKGCLPGEEIFILLFGMHAKAGEIEEAVTLFQKMCESGRQPTVRSYTLLLDTLSAMDKLDRGYALYKELVVKKIYPSAVSCNSLLSRLSKSGKTTMAIEFFREMKTFPGSKPNGVTYNIAIDLFGRTQRFGDAWNEFLSMKRSGCSPCVITYNTLIIRLGRGGFLETCFDLFEEMRERGIAANQYTYCGLVDVLSRYSLVEPALEMLAEMKQRHFHPSFNTLQLVIKSLWRVGDLAAAKQLCDDYPGIYSPQLDSSSSAPSSGGYYQLSQYASPGDRDRCVVDALEA